MDEGQDCIEYEIAEDGNRDPDEDARLEAVAGLGDGFAPRARVDVLGH